MSKDSILNRGVPMETAFAIRQAHPFGPTIDSMASDYLARTTYPQDERVEPVAPTTADTDDVASAVVFVVDHEPFLHEAIELSGRSIGWQVRRFDCAGAFLDTPPILSPSCLVLNVSMPELDVVHLQESIAVDRPNMPIILVVGPHDEPMTIQAGSVSMVTPIATTGGHERVAHAIVNALERSRPAFGRWAHTALLRKRYDSLTNRERQVMALVVAGRLNKQVGGDLGISEITVKAHRGNAMRKMQAKSLPDLVTMVANLGFK
jgi:FixJ family two-component response regulator